MTAALAWIPLAALALVFAAILTAAAIDGRIVRRQEKELHRWN